jgi:hypothetical protein
MSVLEWLVSRIRFYLFRHERPTNLCISRIAFYAGLLMVYWTPWASDFARFGAGFRRTFYFLDAVPVPFLTESQLYWLDIAWRISLVLSMVGLLTRISTWVSFLLGTYLLSIPHQFGTTSHGDGLPILCMLVMACSRCGDAYSLDRRLGLISSESNGLVSGEFRWPIVLTRALLVLVFFTAGLSKIRASRFEWIFSDNLRNVLLWSHYRVSWVPTDLGLWIADKEVLCYLIAASIILIEISSPLALINRTCAIVIIPALLVMQLSNVLILGILFLPFYPCYMFWIPWSAVRDKWRRGYRACTNPVQPTQKPSAFPL